MKHLLSLHSKLSNVNWSKTNTITKTSNKSNSIYKMINIVFKTYSHHLQLGPAKWMDYNHLIWTNISMKDVTGKENIMYTITVYLHYHSYLYMHTLGSILSWP